MLTFALDEQGDFEQATKVNRPVFIGGIIYDDAGDMQDCEVEHKRIAAYYRAVIEDASDGSEEFVFPKALHSNGDVRRDNKVIKPVKKRINVTLGEFLQSGTYEGSQLEGLPERKGRYHIFVILKSNEGMIRLISEHAGTLAKDDYASNLYFHMADAVITRIMFYNPLIDDIRDISLDIATRSSGYMTEDDELAGEYDSLGYKRLYANPSNPDGPFRFSLTNPDIYRTLIAEEILDADKTDINVVDFKVRSIRYGSYDQREKMEFLFLADTICSYLGNSLKGEDAGTWLTRIDNKAQSLMRHSESLIFAYDEIENIFSKAWGKYLDGDYFNALGIAYDACLQDGPFAGFYKKHWFKKLEEKIVQNADVSDYVTSVGKLNEYIYSNEYEQSKGLYIFGIFEKVLPGIEDKFRSPESEKILYTLYDIGVSVYCHLGDSKRASYYCSLCGLKAKLVSLEEYLNTRNKMAVFYCDCFDPKHALNVSNESVYYQEKLTDLKKSIGLTDVAYIGSLSLGKTLSQRAQAYAFLRDERAEDDFRRALELMEKGSDNYKITQSYLLHYYLDMGKKDEYLEEAVDYFDGHNKLYSQLKYIITEGARKDAQIHIKYALYVFVRGIYRFRMDQLTDSIWENLRKTEGKFGRKIGLPGWKLSDHPSEIIFKYMYLISKARGENDNADYYIQRLKESLLNPGPTVEAIRYWGLLQCALADEDEERAQKLEEEFRTFLKENFYSMKKYKNLEEVFTFMYD